MYNNRIYFMIRYSQDVGKSAVLDGSIAKTDSVAVLVFFPLSEMTVFTLYGKNG